MAKKNKLLLILIFAVVVYLLMIIYADFEKLSSALTHFPWILLLGLFLLTTVNYLVRSFKWNFFLKKIGVRLSTKESLFVFFSGLSMIITPGKLGEVWKAWLVNDITGEEVSKTIPVVIVERVTDVLGLIILSMAGIIFHYQTGIYFMGIIVLMIIGFSVMIKSDAIMGKIIALMERKTEKYTENIKLIHESFKKLTHPYNIASMSLLSAFAWFFECLGLYLVVKGFGQSITMTKATFVFSFSSVAGTVSMIPGGLGVAEGSISGLLQLFDLSSTIAVGTSIIIRFATLWYGAILGIVVYILFRSKYLKNSKTGLQIEKKVKNRCRK